MHHLKVAVYVLGCKVNQNEAQAIKRMFKENNYQTVDFSQKADVYIIHTCMVTKEAERKSRQAVRRALKNNHKAVVAATGCYPQAAHEDLLGIKGIDLLVGTGDIHRIVELVNRKIESESDPAVNVRSLDEFNGFKDLPMDYSGRARAFLKVQDGCQQYCSYCIVPFARGPIRSMASETVLKKIKTLINWGYKEIVISGIRLGAYGSDLNPPITLADLLKQAVEIDNLVRLRVSSVDPNDFNSELIEVMGSEDKICPHFHIPLQSGDNEILEKMKRRYKVEEYAVLIDKLRFNRPGAAVTTDIMVGFPGESEQNFLNTKSFLESTGFMDAHIFKYSMRESTPAASFSQQVSSEVKKQRSTELHEVTIKL